MPALRRLISVRLCCLFYLLLLLWPESQVFNTRVIDQCAVVLKQRVFDTCKVTGLIPALAEGRLPLSKTQQDFEFGCDDQVVVSAGVVVLQQ